VSEAKQEQVKHKKSKLEFTTVELNEMLSSPALVATFVPYQIQFAESGFMNENKTNGFHMLWLR
jgi:hypothetical protein